MAQLFLISSFCLAHSTELELSPLEYKIINLLKTSLGENCLKVRLKLDQKSILPQLEKMLIRELKLTNIDPKTQTFTVNVVANDHKHNILLSGGYQCFISIPTLKKAVRTGHLIEENNIKEKDIDINLIDLPSQKLAKKAEDIIGMCAEKDIKSNSFICLNQLKHRFIIQADDDVKMVCSGKNFSVTTSGKAMESGAMGDRIKVQNTKSKKILNAIISGNKTVQLEEQQ